MRQFIMIIENAAAMLNVETEIRHLQQEVAEFGIDLAVRFDPPILWLDRVKRSNGPPGAGKRALFRLFALADVHHLPIHAVVEDYPAVASLLSYYESLGFEIVSEPEYDWEDEEPGEGNKTYEIVRQPA